MWHPRSRWPVRELEKPRGPREQEAGDVVVHQVHARRHEPHEAKLVKVPDGPGTALGSIVVDGEKYLTLSFTVPTGANALDDAEYTLQRATALAPANWSSTWTDFVTASVTPGPGELETVTVRSTRPIGSIPHEFLRFNLTSTAP